MENALSVYKEICYISRFKDEAIKITRQQYDGLAQQLADPQVRFVRIGNRIINVNDIKEVDIVSEKPNTEIYAEIGSNPYFREWAMGDKKKSFKEWVNDNTKNKQ